IGSMMGRQDCRAGVLAPCPGVAPNFQAASILFTSLTNSRRWTGLDKTFAFFGASESEFSATAAKPVMNMILMSGSSSEARRASQASHLATRQRRHVAVVQQHHERRPALPATGRYAVIMGGYLKPALLEGLDQDAAHVVVGFGAEDLVPGICSSNPLEDQSVH